MTRFLIEVPHDNTKEACEQAIQVFLATGSHFMTNADWGCKDSVHKAWFVVEIGSKDEARAILPPLFRRSATIVALNKFGKDDFAPVAKEHG